MPRNLHIISGLPRTGSSLLSSILSQNPEFHADISDPLCPMIGGLINAVNISPGFLTQVPPSKMKKLIKDFVNSYYREQADKICFNTNRSWASKLSLLDQVFPETKMILCTRDIPSILNSFEQLYQANPFQRSSIYSPGKSSTLEERCDTLLSKGFVIADAGQHLQEAFNHPLAPSKCFIMEYDHLVSDPEQTMKSIYSFIGVDYYEHDFQNVGNKHWDFDAALGLPNLHKIDPAVQFKPQINYLSHGLIKKYSGFEFWRR